MTSPMPMYPKLPERCLVVLIGASGAGKSTLASTWLTSQVLSLDALRGAVSDDPGDQEATTDAVDALHLLLKRRMARRLFTVVDATNVTRLAREPLVAAAKQHHMPVIAVLVFAPASVCVERQGPRPANRTVPDATVRKQHTAMLHSLPTLLSEGFNEVVFADSLYRLEPFLQRLSEAREAGLGRDYSESLDDLALVRGFFGPEVLPLWRWKPGSDLASGKDRIAEIRLRRQYLTLAYRHDADGEGNFGFDVLLPCPFDAECTGQAWAPVYSVTDLYRALTGAMHNDPDLFCTIHDGADDIDQKLNNYDTSQDAPAENPRSEPYELEAVGE
ncbi:ATP/GTP-binding protein [Streptomyces sp. NWU339]|uniref:ATP-binding protein n=1 Tax=Streptomyces sp. NWU339 TaxID=2185284 RepID=UPI000D677757|nr:ATP-binding protein [Streptomyces sp. NWU339]PWI06504.1 ATP/GTP-binding protein [Streptomyces sp. NWU339]